MIVKALSDCEVNKTKLLQRWIFSLICSLQFPVWGWTPPPPSKTSRSYRTHSSPPSSPTWALRQLAKFSVSQLEFYWNNSYILPSYFLKHFLPTLTSIIFQSHPDMSWRTIRIVVWPPEAGPSAGGPAIFRNLSFAQSWNQEYFLHLSPTPPASLTATLLIIASLYS